MTVEEIVEANAEFLISDIDGGWEYDGVMEWYMKDGKKEIKSTHPRGLIVNKSIRWGKRVKSGHGHPERDYGTFTVEKDDMLEHLAGSHSNHHDFLMEGIINSFMVGDSNRAFILRRYVEGYSATEIAKELKKSVNQVSTYLLRIRKQINKTLGLDIATKRMVREKRPDVAKRNKKK